MIAVEPLIVADRHMTMIKQKDTKYTKLFVGGIPYETDDYTLRKFFLKFGEIDEAVVIRDRQTKRSKGYGFVSIPGEIFGLRSMI